MQDDRTLARRIEQAQAAGTARTVGRLRATFDDARYDAQPFAGGWLIFAPKDVPLWGGKALGFSALDDVGLDEIVRVYAERDMDTWIEMCPLADPNLDGRLAARGFASRPSCEMYVRDAKAPIERAGSDVEIVPIDREDGDAVELFASTVASGFRDGGTPEAWSAAIGRFAARTRHAFLARIDGESAGGGVVTVEDGLARLVFMATLPAFRRRGVQRALMQARLDRAREQGADTVFVQCDPGSPTARNARRLGFRRAYAKTFRILRRR